MGCFTVLANKEGEPGRTTPYVPIKSSANGRTLPSLAITAPLELKDHSFNFQTLTTTSLMKHWLPTLPPPVQKSPPCMTKKRKIVNLWMPSHPQVNQTVCQRTPSSSPHPLCIGSKKPPFGTSFPWSPILLEDHLLPGTTTSRTTLSTSTLAVWNLLARGEHLLCTMGQVWTHATIEVSWYQGEQLGLLGEIICNDLSFTLIRLDMALADIDGIGAGSLD